jgi:hypothetical protein
MATKGSVFTDEEKKTMEKALMDFKFDDDVVPTHHVIVISGQEGTGKTHLACTAVEAGPVFLLDTEYRAGHVVKKFQNKDRIIKLTPCYDYKDIVVAVTYIIKNFDKGTIIIDSGTDMQVFAEISYLNRTKMEKIWPVFNWTEIWAMCNAIVDKIKRSNLNLIITTRVKEEYVADRATGKQVPRIYNTLPYKADLCIQLFKDKKLPIDIYKNGYNNYEGIVILKTLPIYGIADFVQNFQPKTESAK